MSYDLKIYTIEKQNYENLKNNFRIELSKEGFVYPLKNHQIVVSTETPLEDEDIPLQISKELPGLKYLIECHLEPYSEDEKYVKEFLKICKTIAKNGIGVIENPQTDEVFLPSGIKRVLKTEKTEYFSLLELSWWFNDIKVLGGNNLMKLLNILEKNMWEALPRRYGEYEPPKEIFSDKKSFCDYLIKSKYDIVWYPTKPVDYVHLGIPDFIGPMRLGYRFGVLSISIDSKVLGMPGWKISIIRLFKGVSSILNPFYGDIYILKNNIKSNTVSYSDKSTEQHPILSWWWNGVPKKFGCGLVIGNPLHDFVNIKKPDYELENGCKIIVDAEFNELNENNIVVNKDIYQSKRASQFSGADKKHYPKIWPFDNPFKEA